MNKWYYFIILALIVAVIVAIANIQKLKNMLKSHSEIKDHHETIEKDLKNNGTQFKWLYQYGKKKAKIYGIIRRVKEKVEKIKTKDDKGVDVETTELTKNVYYTLGLRINGKWIFWTVKEHAIF